MKLKLFIVLFLLSTKIYSQHLDYCKYFKLEVSEKEYGAKKAKSFNPAIVKNQQDKFGNFVKNHNNRFDYLLYKNIQILQEISNYYPDTNKIEVLFCDFLNSNKDINKYFKALTPKKIAKWNSPPDTFSVNELMIVASKYFYCDDISKKDTVVKSHICIGINGQAEFKSTRDLTLLEAFTFEAIFSYIASNDEPLFYKEFYKFLKVIQKEKINEFKDFDSYLLEIRNLCYKEMMVNVDLKNKLVSYYKNNKSNLNFILD
jgi:hypothetical protein